MYLSFWAIYMIIYIYIVSVRVKYYIYRITSCIDSYHKMLVNILFFSFKKTYMIIMMYNVVPPRYLSWLITYNSHFTFGLMVDISN